MIKTFRCKDTQALFEDKCPRRFKAIVTVAERKLQMLDDAYALEDLRVPPGNRLEALHGSRKGDGAFASMTNGAYASASRTVMPLMSRP